MTEPASAGDPAGDGYPGLPRWIKVSAIVVAIVVLAIIVGMLIAGGDHGPGRHAAGLAQW
jgi:hypothetical protein